MRMDFVQLGSTLKHLDIEVLGTDTTAVAVANIRYCSSGSLIVALTRAAEEVDIAEETVLIRSMAESKMMI